MKPKDYIATQLTIIELGKKVLPLNLDGFLKCISNAETVAPIVDPTLFIAAQEKLEAIKKLAKAAKEFQTAFHHMQDTIIRTHALYQQQQEEECEEHA